MEMQEDKKMKVKVIENKQRNSKLFGGLIVVAVGVLILLKQMNVYIADWILSWEMILIVVGVSMLVKHKFQKTSAYVLILIGVIFMLNDFYPNSIETRFVWPVLIILVGISMLFKNNNKYGKHRSKCTTPDLSFEEVRTDDYVNSSAVFSGVTKKVVTKDFKGATISSVFGGNEINLSQADFVGERTIDVTCVFGGITLIVPSSWNVKSDLTSIFGGIEDQRTLMTIESGSEDKVLYLKGKCIFGGIEIQSIN